MHPNLRLKLKTLLKNSFILFLLVFLVACNGELKQTVKQVDEIDAKYSVQLSDYENGLTWFDSNVREIPLNQDELKEIVKELNTFKEGKDGPSLDYIEFRINLFQAEKLYKSASRRPRGARQPSKHRQRGMPHHAIRLSARDQVLEVYSNKARTNTKINGCGEPDQFGEERKTNGGERNASEGTHAGRGGRNQSPPNADRGCGAGSSRH